MPEHRVLLFEVAEPGAKGGSIHFQRRRQFLDLLVAMRQELMKRRIEQADRDGQPPHDLEQLDEVLALHGQNLRQRGAPAVFVGSHDHLAHRHDAGRVEEHVLGTAKADTFRSKLPRLSRIVRRVGVRAHLHAPHAIGPFHKGREVAGEFRLAHGNLTPDHLPCRAVDRDHLTFLERHTACGEGAQFGIDAKSTRAGDAGPPHAASHNGCVACHAAACGQNTGRRMHAVDVFGACFGPHKDNGLALTLQLLGIVRREDNLAAGGAGGRRQAGGNDVTLRRGIDGRMKKLIELSRLDAGYRLLPC